MLFLFIHFSKAQKSKIIQSGGSFGSWLGNLGKKGLINIAISLARDNLLGLVGSLTSNAINLNEKCLFISNEDMNYIIRTIKSLEDSCVLVDGVTETVKHKIKKECRFLGALLVSLDASLVQPVISSVVKGISGRGVRRAGRGCMDKNFLVLLHPLNNIKITNCFKCEP